MKVFLVRRSQYKKSLEDCFQRGADAALTRRAMEPKAQVSVPAAGGSTYRAENTGDEKKLVSCRITSLQASPWTVELKQLLLRNTAPGHTNQ